MKCPRCENDETKVLESRLSAEGKSVRRRRQCLRCDLRFTTYEKVELYAFQVRKRDGRLEPYQRDKASNSIQIACRKRPITLEMVEGILNRVESQINESGCHVITSKTLGEYILSELFKLDSVAYVRFASVYKDFKTPKEFLEELSPFTQ